MSENERSCKIINFSTNANENKRVELIVEGPSLAGQNVKRHLRGDLLSPLLIIIATMSHNGVLRKCTRGDTFFISPENPNHLHK